MRRNCSPCWISNTGEHIPLKQVDFNDKQIAEKWLQDALSKSPDLLPVAEINSSFTPLISLGREIDSIDNLYISPNGRITIVETKLWRNPEATREVVAQIMDYATRLIFWSYTDLENNAKKALSPAPLYGKTIYELVCSYYPEQALPEKQFIDEVQRTLSNGRFMLLVVGDGIRENVKHMVGSLHQHPRLLFTFGLVELQIYEHKSFEGKLIVPQLLAHTTEIVRAVVRVETKGEAKVSIDFEEESKDPKPKRRRTLSEDEFFEEIDNPRTTSVFKSLLSFTDDIDAIPGWRSSSVSIRLQDPRGSRQELTLFVLTTSGQMYFGWLPGQLESISCNPEIGFNMLEDIASLFKNVKANREGCCLSRNLNAEEIENKYDDFIEIIKNTVDKIKSFGK